MPSSSFGFDSLVETIGSGRGQNLAPEEKAQIELWRKGRDLGQIVTQPGWEVALEMLQGYFTGALTQLMTIPPGDNDRVLAAQAVAYGLNEINVNFRQDVDAAVAFASTTPPVMAQFLHGTGMPPESMY